MPRRLAEMWFTGINLYGQRAAVVEVFVSMNSTAGCDVDQVPADDLSVGDSGAAISGAQWLVRVVEVHMKCIVSRFGSEKKSLVLGRHRPYYSSPRTQKERVPRPPA